MHPILDPHQFLSGWIDSSSVFMPVRQQYPDLFARCDEIARSCPARMGGAANLDLLYALSEHLQALRVVETGVSYGWSSLALLLSLRKRAGARLISTDLPYPNEPEVERYTGCLVPQELHDQWTLLRMADRDGLPQVLGLFSEIDLCHYDSDKSYAGRMWAYPLL
jgi:predicted O-methyltransferase YrrM